MTLVDADTSEVVATLESCEQVIERGLGTFVEVGNALLTIRDQKLYRADHDTFESYCQQRWGFSRSRAHRLIEASEVAAVLPIGNKPTNEAQARELAPVRDRPDLAAEAMRRAAADEKKPTANAVRDAVKDVVREELAKAADAAAQKAEDREALTKLASDMKRAGFDDNEERTQQRGAFARLCRDLAGFPPPADFITYQDGHLRDRHGEYAAQAHAWLSTFLDEWGSR